MSARPSAILICLSSLGCASGRVSAPPPPPAIRTSTPGAEASAARVNAPQPAPVPSDPVETASPPPSAVPSSAGESPASAPPEANPSTTPAESKRDDVPLGWIAGVPLEPEEFLVEWGDVASHELFLVVDKLVAARLAMAEADRLGIRLDPEEVEKRFGEERTRLEQQVAKSSKGNKSESLEDFIAHELGFEPGRYLERVRRATIRQMLAERAVRAGSLASDSVALRLIVVPSQAELDKVQAALAAGRDFGDVARELSVDDSREDGGLVPFVVPQERSPLSRLAFQTPVGETAGPLPISDHQFLIRVEQRRTALEGDWAAIGTAVEASLLEHPVADAEFVHWKLTVEGRYPIDLGPLWRLIGAAR